MSQLGTQPTPANAQSLLGAYRILLTLSSISLLLYTTLLLRKIQPSGSGYRFSHLQGCQNSNLIAHDSLLWSFLGAFGCLLRTPNAQRSGSNTHFLDQRKQRVGLIFSVYPSVQREIGLLRYIHFVSIQQLSGVCSRSIFIIYPLNQLLGSRNKPIFIVYPLKGYYFSAIA